MKVRVFLSSEPGMWERYEGHVDVVVDSLGDAVDAAKRKLKTGAFPDRPLSGWRVINVQVVG